MKELGADSRPVVDQHLRNQELWHAAMESDPQLNVWLDRQSVTTIAAYYQTGTPLRGLEWGHDHTTVKYRWQRALDYVAEFAVPDNEEGEYDFSGRLRIAREIVDDSTGQTTGRFAGIRNMHGKDVAGVSFTVPDNTWWHNRVDWKDDPNPAHYHQIDLRDFTPRATVIPKKYEDYKQFSNDEKKWLRAYAKNLVKQNTVYGKYPWDTAPHGYGDAWGDLVILNRLKQFEYFEKYGYPDKDLDKTEIDQYVSDLVAYRKTKDPMYGKLGKVKHYDKTTINNIKTLWHILDYVQYRGITPDVFVEADLSANEGWLDKSGIENLVAVGALQKLLLPKRLGRQLDGYRLSPRFEGVWLAQNCS